MFKNVKDLGLVPDADYLGQGVEIVIDGEVDLRYNLVRTAKKILFVDKDGEVKRLTLKKVHSAENIVEPVGVKVVNKPKRDPLKLGLESNTDYSGQNILVEHADKGEFSLVRTSAKLVFAEDSEGNKVRFTLPKLVRVEYPDGQVEQEARETASDEADEDIHGVFAEVNADNFFDSEFAWASRPEHRGDEATN